MFVQFLRHDCLLALHVPGCRLCTASCIAVSRGRAFSNWPFTPIGLGSIVCVLATGRCICVIRDVFTWFASDPVRACIDGGIETDIRLRLSRKTTL